MQAQRRGGGCSSEGCCSTGWRASSSGSGSAAAAGACRRFWESRVLELLGQKAVPGGTCRGTAAGPEAVAATATPAPATVTAAAAAARASGAGGGRGRYTWQRPWAPGRYSRTAPGRSQDPVSIPGAPCTEKVQAGQAGRGRGRIPHAHSPPTTWGNTTALNPGLYPPSFNTSPPCYCRSAAARYTPALGYDPLPCPSPSQPPTHRPAAHGRHSPVRSRPPSTHSERPTNYPPPQRASRLPPWPSSGSGSRRSEAARGCSSLERTPPYAACCRQHPVREAGGARARDGGVRGGRG